MEERAAIVGGGGWGTALAVLLAGKGFKVAMWARSTADAINRLRENPDYLPGVTIPEGVTAYAEPGDWISKHQLVILSVPSQYLFSVLSTASPFFHENQVFVNTAKGIELTTLARLSEVVRRVVPSSCPILALSGPNHAEEVARDVPSATVISGTDPVVTGEVQDFFMTSRFRVYTNSDLIGVELAGALKNIIALATGISDGLGFGDNTRAAIMTRGLAEIARLGVAMGADPLTFLGLAGMGDLVATCTSRHSRNSRAGREIGRGKSLEQVLRETKMVVEGVATSKAARLLAGRYGVDLPITTKVYRVLFEGLPPERAVDDLMERGPKDEQYGVLHY